MTREQELERQLADWLVDGPSTAPAEVVDMALAQTAGRRQRPRVWRLLALPLARLERWFPGHRAARPSAFAAVLVGIVLTIVIVSAPFMGGGPGPSPTPTPAPSPTLAPAPLMDAGAIRAVAGMAAMIIESETPTMQVRSVVIDTGDQRVDGRARQDLTVRFDTGDIAQLRGDMHLDNAWGAWDGTVDVVRYPSGEEYEYASLRGSGAYQGFIYEYTVRQATAEAERAVEGAIWPGEPPPMLDPSVLP